MNGNGIDLVAGRPLSSLILFFWLLLNLALIGIWDAWLMYKGRANETVSAVFQAWNSEFSLVAWIVGFLTCHLVGLAGRH